MLFGDKIKELREEQSLLQRQLAAYLEIDTPMFSKIERGDRRAKREQVIKLAEYLHQDEKEMLTLWLADKTGISKNFIKFVLLLLFFRFCHLGAVNVQLLNKRSQISLCVFKSLFEF